MTVMRKHKTTIQNCTGQQTIHTLNQVLIFLAIIKKSVCPIREMLKWEEVAQAGLEKKTHTTAEICLQVFQKMVYIGMHSDGIDEIRPGFW